MKNLFLTVFFLSLLILTNLAWSRDFCDFQSVKEKDQNLYFEKENLSITERMDFNISHSPLKYFCSEELTAVDTVQKGYPNNSKNVKKKSPTAAFLIALVPGSVVHGAGHFYAGKLKTGAFLVGTELAGIGLFYLGAVSGMSENLEDEKDRGELEWIGFGLFLFSWLYDVIESPSVVNKQNQRLSKTTSQVLEIHTLKNYKEIQLLLSIRF